MLSQTEPDHSQAGILDEHCAAAREEVSTNCENQGCVDVDWFCLHVNALDSAEQHVTGTSIGFATPYDKSVKPRSGIA